MITDMITDMLKLLKHRNKKKMPTITDMYTKKTYSNKMQS